MLLILTNLIKYMSFNELFFILIRVALIKKRRRGVKCTLCKGHFKKA
ncbi:hypothetical protein BSG1_17840 [Bacillus sp. SG-1]|nr:hypothetical protein BSG1_17840 [Bacillus sp. SG-1]